MRRPELDPSAALTSEVIAEAALRVLDDEGPGELSFRRVAALLGVSHTTVHRHCGNWEGLLDACAEHLAATLPEIDPSLPWAVSVEARFLALYDVLAAHPNLVVLQRGRPWLGPNMMRHFAEPAVAAGLAAGLGIRDVVRAHRTLYTFTVGSVLTSTTYDTRLGRRSMAVLDPAEFPTLSSHLDELVDHTSHREVFLTGVRHLIRAFAPA